MNTIPFVQEIFRRVDQVARVENLSPEDRREYERDLKFTRDYRNTIRYAEMKAHEKGLQKGLQEGRQEGRQEGLKEERKKLVISMMKNGLSIEMISQIAGLSQAEIEEIVKDSL